MRGEKKEGEKVRHLIKGCGLSPLPGEGEGAKEGEVISEMWSNAFSFFSFIVVIPLPRSTFLCPAA